MKLSLIALSTLATLILVSSVATAEKKKSTAGKVHVCESVDLYFGMIGPGTRTERLAYECKDTTPKAAQRMIDKCVKEGAATCEVLREANTKTLLIEHKIQVSPSSSEASE